jgi:ubiquinone/menaquinone biosynthesis C-methylase UbiE
LRYLILPPGRLVRRLALAPSDEVLEVGCGPGYFSPSVAGALHKGRLTLYDIQRAMLDMAEARLRKRKLTNFEIVEGNAATLPFGDGRFDVVFLVTVLGEVEDRAAAMAEFVRVLRPGGRLSITEQFGDPDYVRFTDLTHLAAARGLAFERRFGPRFFYTANFRKAAV